MGLNESTNAIAAVDSALARVGMTHGSRKTRSGTWEAGERKKKPVSGDRTTHTPSPGEKMLVRAVGWEAFPWLQHGFSTRLGGFSKVYGPGELNLGWTVSDDPVKVAENRQRFLKEIAGAKSQARLVTLRQVHSGVVRIVERDSGAFDGKLESAEGKAVMRGDGMMTDVPAVLLGVQVADCVPVLVADVKRKAVAAFHAGWRGTLRRIVERGIGRMQLRYGSRPEDLIAAIGPSIGACCYSVGEEVRHEFESQFAYAPELFSEVYDSDPVKEKYPLLFLTARAPGHSNIGPQIHLNLWEANRRQLLDAGLRPERVSVIGECTACTRVTGGRLKYYSHRGEAGFAGRMMGVIGVAR
jgi:YfiH family protein